MKIVVRAEADHDLDRIFAWIATDNPAAARAMIRRIRERIGQLGEPGFARTGRPSRLTGVREAIVPPYVIVYEVDDGRDELVILAIFHGAQDR
jgi:addiction module RelE/StbE family toxin